MKNWNAKRHMKTSPSLLKCERFLRERKKGEKKGMYIVDETVETRRVWWRCWLDPLVFWQMGALYSPFRFHPVLKEESFCPPMRETDSSSPFSESRMIAMSTRRQKSFSPRKRGQRSWDGVREQKGLHGRRSKACALYVNRDLWQKIKSW